MKNLPKCFNNFFISKITKIRDTLAGNQDQLPLPPVSQQRVAPHMDIFRVLSEDEGLAIVRKYPTKSCEADPIPTALLKEILPDITPLLTAVVNKSLQTGIFLDDFKEAFVKPRLKKINLDLIERNYRPVSNLQFVGKLTERAVTDQLNAHITNNLMEPMQSAYRARHSTESALVKVKADLLNAINNKEVVSLVLLDLSVALDTVDHQLLLERLKKRFGFTGLVINWIRFYLTCRSQKVVVGDVKSPPVSLSYGVPQGSILGPIFFTLYITPLGEICTKHGIKYHVYADDQQLYLAFKLSNTGAKE